MPGFYIETGVIKIGGRTMKSVPKARPPAPSVPSPSHHYYQKEHLKSRLGYVLLLLKTVQWCPTPLGQSVA